MSDTAHLDSHLCGRTPDMTNVDIESEKSRRLTVAHIIPWMGMGGVEIATLRLAIASQYLIRNVAFCRPEAQELRQAFEDAGIETITYTPPEPSLRHVHRFYRECRQMARKIQDSGADVIHFADMEAGYRNAYAGLFSGRRFVCHIRGRVPKLGIRYRLALLPITKFIFVSKEARSCFALRASKRNSVVLYDAVNIPDPVPAQETRSVRNEFRIPDNSPVVGMVSRISPAKDFYTLALAARKVAAKYPSVRFLVVGDNAIVDVNRTHYDEVSKQIRDCGVEDLFIFTGHRNDMPQMISAMDVCVLCSHREGFPLSVIEMMAMKKPVIASAVGGIPEVITSGVTGYLHKHGDSDELGSMILSLLEDREKAERVAAAGFQHVSATYTTNRFLNELLAIYSGLMRDKGEKTHPITKAGS